MKKNKTLQILWIITLFILGLSLNKSYAQINQDKTEFSMEKLRTSLHPEGFVMHDPEWYFWGASPVWDDNGKLHVYVSRWPKKYGFAGWRDVSEIAHYVADSPKGPFKYVDTPLKPTMIKGHWRGYCLHSATVSRIDEKWVMTFMGVAWNEGESKILARNQANGLAVADTPNGPWKLVGNDGLVIDIPADSSFWCYNSINGACNPTLIKTHGGQYLYYFKANLNVSGKNEWWRYNRYGVAVANHLEGPYHILPIPVLGADPKGGHYEDGNVFYFDNKICLLVTDCENDNKGGGSMYYSEDGIHFNSQPIQIYQSLSHYAKWEKPSHQWGPWVLQVPRILLDNNGVPTHLYVASGTAPEGYTTTGIFMFSIKE